MSRRFWDVRPEERGLTLAAFLVNFGILAAHTILETARDALFLARLPASQLPWMYLAMAAIAAALAVGPSRGTRGPLPLPALLALCASGTFAFWLGLSSEGPWALRVLYVWTGLVASL